mgnify:CR=1 FL=1
MAVTVREHRQDAYAMVQYESACIERELWREREVPRMSMLSASTIPMKTQGVLTGAASVWRHAGMVSATRDWAQPLAGNHRVTSLLRGSS